MFDPVTAALIASSPQLSGLDLAGLPKRLTEAYADIVAARIAFRNRDGAAVDQLSATLGELRRLAAAHEAHVALLPDRDTRVAAAFVAASAHQAVLLAKPQATRLPSFLEGYGVSPDVSASLLFLAADAHADAAECAKRIAVDDANQGSVVGQLLTGIRLLCQGRLDAIRQMNEPAITREDRAERAVEALYLELFKGLRNLAARMMSRVDVPVEQGGIEPASASFLRVKVHSSEELPNTPGVEQHVFSMFPGPLHLANLLLAVDRDLGLSALARTPPPKGVDGDNWWNVLRKMARKRPYLWRNHKQAIESGYLETGISAAISFPTGGGKSTLAELKIASSLLRSKKVVFLVPTHALVDQTTRALKDTFADFEIVGDVEDEASTVEFAELPEAIVTTPERCLMLLTSQPEAFSDLGLVAFDECHLLHPKEVEKSRRSVDAMLAVLNLASVAKEADFLFLSAMMKNAEEISNWVEALTDRPCLPLNVSWKPTRQVRGCVVYPASRIEQLREVLVAAKLDHPKAKNLPVSIGRTLTARPFGFFSLLQTWASQDRNDYTLLPLLREDHRLSTGKNVRGWHLTPNGNHTSSVLAASSAQGGMRTLVFAQTVPLVESSVAEIRALQQAPAVALNADEDAALKVAEEELGGFQYLYIGRGDDGSIPGGAVSHHSMLLREERFVHESLFKREGGVDVLVATSTVAQGMNFPAEVVLISGDSRFDPDANKLAQLEAHELLNAAGRAGRAGESSQGFVLVVPSRVVDFDENSNLINAHWMTLQSIFSQSDQCIEIDDPLTALLDQIHAGAATQGMPAYLLSRLPSSNGEGGALKAIVNRSLGAFRARQRGDESWVETRIATAIEARKAIEIEEQPDWLDQVSGLTGVPNSLLTEIEALFPDGEKDITTPNAIDRIFAWLEARPSALLSLVRPENVADLFGGKYEALSTDGERGSHSIPVIQSFLGLWMKGAPLCDLEAIYPDNPDMKRCKHARHFALRLVPDLAFVAGLVARIMVARSPDPDNPNVPPVSIATLAAAVKEGCDSQEALATRIVVGRSISRPAARKHFQDLLPYLPAAKADETFEDTLERVRSAGVLKAFSSAE